MKNTWIRTNVAIGFAFIAGCGGASYARSTTETVPSADSISDAELDERLSREDAVAMARFDRATGYRVRNTQAGTAGTRVLTGQASEESTTPEEAISEPSPPALPAPTPDSYEASGEESRSQRDEDSVCVDSCGYREQICELSSRICDIAARHPEYSDIAERCSDGQRRCDAARAHTNADCDC